MKSRHRVAAQHRAAKGLSSRGELSGLADLHQLKLGGGPAEGIEEDRDQVAAAALLELAAVDAGDVPGIVRGPAANSRRTGGGRGGIGLH
jgi:hypothetical protein